jgi:hypothetical protein
MSKTKVFLVLLALTILAALALLLADNIIQTDVGDLEIAPHGKLISNTTKIQMRSPDASWSCCGVNATGNWTCTAGEC